MVAKGVCSLYTMLVCRYILTVHTQDDDIKSAFNQAQLLHDLHYYIFNELATFNLAD